MDKMGILDVHDFRKMDVDQLYAQMATCQSPGYYQLAVEELQRRYLKDVGSQVERLVEATNHVHREVGLLADSSNKLEGLTVRLKNLTWVLIFLTFLAAAVPIGIEVWKAYHELQIKPVSAQPTP